MSVVLGGKAIHFIIPLIDSKQCYEGDNNPWPGIWPVVRTQEKVAFIQLFERL